MFGDHFLYSNCRQGRNRKLRELAPGSLVVFGSKFQGEFVLDTVLVVGDFAQGFTAAAAGEIRCEEWIRAVVFEPLRVSAKRGEHFRLYRGRSYPEAPAGPFSFVPCRPHGGRGVSAFARPALRLPRRWIEPNLAMGAKATPASPADIRGLWNEIVRHVIDGAGLALGVRLEAPPHADDMRADTAGQTGA